MSHESRDIPEDRTSERKRKRSECSRLNLEEKLLPNCSNSNYLKTLTQRQSPDASQSKKRILPPKKISLNLSSKSSSGNVKFENSKVQPLSEDVAKVFGQDESEEEEEMPIEARIRMRNKGRETPTSSGPNSFGKSRYGFIDRRALLNKQLEALNEMVSGDNEDN